MRASDPRAIHSSWTRHRVSWCACAHRALDFGAMESGSETDESEHPLPPPGSSRDGSLLAATTAAVKYINRARFRIGGIACAVDAPEPSG